MKENFDGGSAFPEPVPSQCGGMTLRDYFAAKAMLAMLSREAPLNSKIMAIDAYIYADAMLAARGDV